MLLHFTKKTCFHFTLILLLLPLAPDSQAELYKWTDEKGKVHYSDRQPAKESNTQVIPIKPSNLYDGTQENYSKTRLKPYEKEARPLWLLDTQYSWRKSSASNKKRKIGSYHAGRGCTSRGAMNVPDVLIFHKELFPTESELAYKIRKVIHQLDYPADKTSPNHLLSDMNKSDGLSLQSEILSMDFKTCAPSLSSNDRLTPVIELPSRKFSRHRIKLSVQWTLKSAESSRLLFEDVTVGSYSGWDKSSTASEAILSAVEKATIELFSKPLFVGHILRDAPVVSSKDKQQVPAARSDNESSVTGSPGIKNIFIIKARMAEVLSDLAHIKILVSQYYLERGQWPYSIVDLGLSSRDFADSQGINDVILQSNGAIIAELTSIFGANRRLELTPSESALGLRWKCSSNLHQAHLPSNCESYQ